MGYGKYVGRVGTLAVAIGIGCAVASAPGIGYAQPSDTNSRSASDDSSSSKPPSRTTISSTPVGDGASADGDDHSGDPAPSGPVSPSDSTQTPSQQDAADEGPADADSTLPADTDNPVDTDDPDKLDSTETPAGDHQETATDQDQDRPAEVVESDTTPVAGPSRHREDDPSGDTVIKDYGDTPVTGDDPQDSPNLPNPAGADVVDDADPDEPDQPLIALDVIPATEDDLATSVFTSLATPAPPAPDLTAVVEAPHPVAGGLADLVDSVLATVLASLGPGSPLQSSTLWAALASVRDELQKAIAPTGAAGVAQLTHPELTDPDTWLAFAGDLVVEALTTTQDPQETVQLVLPDPLDPGGWVQLVEDVAYDTNVITNRMVNIYDLHTLTGWTAMVLDYTWGLPWTAAGNVVHVINLFYPDAGYRDDLSYHQNHAVYQNGLTWWKGSSGNGAAHTVGNVITNASTGDADVSPGTVMHENVHVWENRVFGPIMQASYAGWFVGGGLVGTAIWLTDTNKDWYKTVMTLAYLQNPWEYRAYKETGYWPHPAADPDLVFLP